MGRQSELSPSRRRVWDLNENIDLATCGGPTSTSTSSVRPRKSVVVGRNNWGANVNVNSLTPQKVGWLTGVLRGFFRELCDVQRCSASTSRVDIAAVVKKPPLPCTWSLKVPGVSCVQAPVYKYRDMPHVPRYEAGRVEVTIQQEETPMSLSRLVRRSMSQQKQDFCRGVEGMTCSLSILESHKTRKISTPKNRSNPFRA